MKTATPERLALLVGLVHDLLAAADAEMGPMPPFEAGFDVRSAWWKRQEAAYDAMKQRLAEEGARFSERAADERAIHLAGTRSTSTTGWHGVFTNWIAAVERRIEKETAR